MKIRIILPVIVLVLVIAFVLKGNFSQATDPLRDTDNSYIWSESKIQYNTINACLLCMPNGDVYIGNYDGIIIRRKAGGQDWEESSQGIKKCWINSLASDSGGRIYAATGRGVFRSADGGNRWKPFNNGLKDLGAGPVVTGNNEIYTATRGILYKLDKSKDRWMRIGSLPYPDVSFDDMAVTSNGTVYIIVSNELYKGNSDARKWSHISFPDDRMLNCILVGYDDSIYVGFSPVDMVEGKHYFEWTDAPSLMKSKDGSQWDALDVYDEPVYVYDLVQSKDGSVIAGTSLGPMISANKGNTWQLMLPDLYMHGLPAEFSGKPCKVASDSSGRIYYLVESENTIWCGTPKR